MRSFLALSLLLAAAPALAQVPSDDELRAACTGDVLRFCAIHIPDRNRIGACMVANRTELTPACRTAVDAATPARSRAR